MKCIFHTGFFLFHFYFSSSPYTNYCNTTCEFCNALLEFFAIVIAGRLFDLNTDLFDAGLNALCVACAIDQGGILFADFNALCTAEFREGGFFKGHAGLFRDYGAACEDGHIFEHCFAAITKAWCFYCNCFQNAAHVVDDQCCKCLAFNIFRNNQEGAASLRDLLEYGQEIADVGDLFVVEHDKWIFEQRALLFGVIDEVGRQVAAIKLHTLDNIKFVVQRFAVFYGNYAFLADFLHGLRDDVADLLIGVGGNRAHLGDFFGSCAWFADFFEFFGDRDYCLIDTPLQIHGVHASSNILHTFANNCLG